MELRNLFHPVPTLVLPANNSNHRGCLPRPLLLTEAIVARDSVPLPTALGGLQVVLPLALQAVRQVVLQVVLRVVPQFPMLGFPWVVEWANP